MISRTPRLIATAALFALGSLCRLGVAADSFEAPVPIMVGGRVLELTERSDRVAAPALFDWDGDGRRDLFVGQNAGRMRVFRNFGTDERPEFSEPVWFDELLPDGRIPVG